MVAVVVVGAVVAVVPGDFASGQRATEGTWRPQDGGDV